MDFEAYLVSKRIDSARFLAAEPALWNSWNQEFEQMHPNSFTVQKLNLINPIRRRFQLEVKEAPKGIAQRPASPEGAPGISPPGDAGAPVVKPAAPKVAIPGAVKPAVPKIPMPAGAKPIVKVPGPVVPVKKADPDSPAAASTAPPDAATGAPPSAEQPQQPDGPPPADVSATPSDNPKPKMPRPVMARPVIKPKPKTD